jgi:hypothetical protein
MKKRTKITLRTKIYLTIVGLLALTGVFYAQFPPAHPVPFASGIPFPTGMAASPDLVLVTEFCSENIDKIDCNGNASVFATFPGFGSCREKYMTIAPSQSAVRGFTPRDVFATEGAAIFRVDSTGTVTLFTAIAGCIASDHNGITFDHFGTFGFDMIVTCQEGDVFRIDNLPGGPHVTQIASLFPAGGGHVEGPAVVPPGFGPHGGEIWVADEDNNAVHTIGLPPTYTVTLNVLSHVSAEGVFVIPSAPCTFCSGGAFFQTEQQLTQLVWQYPLTDFTLPTPGLGGNVLITSENGGIGADTSLVTVSGGSYVQSSFGPRIPGSNEGSSFVDCDVPTPTPTPTPSATFTPTATATATATATPTPTPTATVTPTTCGTAFVIGDLDAVVGNTVTFWGAQWWKKNHLSGGTAPASFKGFANCTNPNPPACGGTWISDPGNSSHPPDTVPADMTVIVSSLITKSGSIESGDIPKMVTIHTNPGYDGNPGHAGTGTVTSVVCGMGPQQAVVTTNPATNLTTSLAKLNGSVNPHGSSTTVYFKWGTTTSYGHTTATQSKTGNTSLPITANIGGLTTHHTYHFRIVATNSAGTRTGSDLTFNTP